MLVALYQDPTNGGYGMYDTNMNSLGSCVKPNPVQIANCPDFGSADSVAGIFHCMYSAMPPRFYCNRICFRLYQHYHQEQQLMKICNTL